MVIRTPAIYISQHSDVWQCGSGLEDRSRRAGMSVFIFTLRRHCVSGIRMARDCRSSVNVTDGVRQTLLTRGLTVNHQRLCLMSTGPRDPPGCVRYQSHHMAMILAILISPAKI